VQMEKLRIKGRKIPVFRYEQNKRASSKELALYMARPKRFELLTPWFVAKYSIQLSYGRKKNVRRIIRESCTLVNGGERGIRTLDTGLSPYASLAGKCLRPLGHLSAKGVILLEYYPKIKPASGLKSAEINEMQPRSL
jgi:hypothetical protein